MNDDSFCNILRSVRDALRSRCVIQFRRYRKKTMHLNKWKRERGFSSAGRAPALQAGGQRFDPANLHQLKMDWSIREIEYFNLVSNQKTSPSSPHQKSNRFLKEKEQGSGQSIRRKGERAASGLCDDAMYLENWTMQQQSEVRQQRGSVSEKTQERIF